MNPHIILILLEILVATVHQAKDTTHMIGVCLLDRGLLKQVVVLVPICNPDGYEIGKHQNHAGIDIYSKQWTLDGPADPANMPEAVAVQELFEELQPELLADLHGTDMNFEEYTMLENSGASYSNSAIQPYDHGVAQLMDQAALEEGGFGSDRLAGDAQVATWGPAVDVGPLSHKLWEGRPQIYAATYCCERRARSRCPMLWTKVGHIQWSSMAGFTCASQERSFAIG